MKIYKDNELKVFISHRSSTCGECGEDLGSKAWITLNKEKGAVCLACADLEYLVFLSSGDTALTVRSRKYSKLSAVVLKWSRARKRYERQGVLVDSDALEKAEQECLSDSEARARKRERNAERRAELDRQYVDRFAKRLLELFPRCPAGRNVLIAEHACLKFSGRVGRSAMAKELEEQAVRHAVIAHVRHAETNYDELLNAGYERWEAREAVAEKVDRILEKWTESGGD
ncbi:MAG TPA: DUF2293 domain-containing protein [Acidobacteriota bacterium]|nr:DUF2293 domain-containing protein [Acidobacteriota bacterium]